MVTHWFGRILSAFCIIFVFDCSLSCGESESHTKIASGCSTVVSVPFRISSMTVVMTIVLPEPVGARNAITCGRPSTLW